MSQSSDLIYNAASKSINNESNESVTIRAIQRSDPNVSHGAIGADYLMAPGSELGLDPVRVGPGASDLTVVWRGADDVQHLLHILVEGE